jgi:hypothetical protein
LHVAQWDAGIQGGGDEGMAEGVRPDPLFDGRPFCDPAHDSRRAVAVQGGAVRPDEDRARGSPPDGQVDRQGCARRQRGGDDLAALAQHPESAMPPLETEGFDVRAGGF